MTETTTTPKPPPTQPPCTVCGATDHTSGFHESIEPTGFHESGVDDTDHANVATGFHESSVPVATSETNN
jgi:hypothetical protein